MDVSGEFGNQVAFRDCVFYQLLGLVAVVSNGKVCLDARFVLPICEYMGRTEDSSQSYAHGAVSRTLPIC